MAYKPIRVGQISVVDRDAGTARVTFPDLDNLVTDFLPIISKERASWVKTNDFPEVGENVLVVFLSVSSSDGFILGNYQIIDDDPALTKDQFGAVFEDGSRAYYDCASKRLVVESVGDVDVTAAGEIMITATTVTINAANTQVMGNMNVSGNITGGGL